QRVLPLSPGSRRASGRVVHRRLLHGRPGLRAHRLERARSPPWDVLGPRGACELVRRGQHGPEPERSGGRDLQSPVDRAASDRHVGETTMRDGLVPGRTGELEITVTPAMVAQFDELGLVHPVYATWTLV